MDLEELQSRLAALEDDKAQGAAMAAQQAFIGQHGNKFSNDESIGAAILGELSKRGVGAADVGADAVVQEILDAIRTEAMALVEKINKVGEAVSAATGEQPTAELPPMPSPEAMPPAPEGMVPPLLPEPSMPAPENMGPPAEMPPEPLPPEEKLPPAAVVSDKRMKLVQQPKKGWRPGSHLTSAARGGR